MVAPRADPGDVVAEADGPLSSVRETLRLDLDPSATFKKLGIRRNPRAGLTFVASSGRAGS